MSFTGLGDPAGEQQLPHSHGVGEGQPPHHINPRPLKAYGGSRNDDNVENFDPFTSDAPLYSSEDQNPVAVPLWPHEIANQEVWPQEETVAVHQQDQADNPNNPTFRVTDFCNGYQPRDDYPAVEDDQRTVPSLANTSFTGTHSFPDTSNIPPYPADNQSVNPQHLALQPTAQDLDVHETDSHQGPLVSGYNAILAGAGIGIESVPDVAYGVNHVNTSSDQHFPAGASTGDQFSENHVLDVEHGLTSGGTDPTQAWTSPQHTVNQAQSQSDAAPQDQGGIYTPALHPPQKCHKRDFSPSPSSKLLPYPQDNIIPANRGWQHNHFTANGFEASAVLQTDASQQGSHYADPQHQSQKSQHSQTSTLRMPEYPLPGMLPQTESASALTTPWPSPVLHRNYHQAPTFQWLVPEPHPNYGKRQASHTIHNDTLLSPTSSGRNSRQELGRRRSQGSAGPSRGRGSISRTRSRTRSSVRFPAGDADLVSAATAYLGQASAGHALPYSQQDVLSLRTDPSINYQERDSSELWDRRMNPSNREQESLAAPALLPAPHYLQSFPTGHTSPRFPSPPPPTPLNDLHTTQPAERAQPEPKYPRNTDPESIMAHAQVHKSSETCKWRLETGEYECMVCRNLRLPYDQRPRVFGRSQSLKKHIENEAFYTKCPLCGLEQRRDNNITHFKAKHKGQTLGEDDLPLLSRSDGQPWNGGRRNPSLSHHLH